MHVKQLMREYDAHERDARRPHGMCRSGTSFGRLLPTSVNDVLPTPLTPLQRLRPRDVPDWSVRLTSGGRRRRKSSERRQDPDFSVLTAP